MSNACDSEDHARVLSEVLDFTIGHRAPVDDENAIDFSGMFFDCLFGCNSLMDSFNQAKSCSKGYRLFSPERDPRQFYLAHSRHLSAGGRPQGGERPQDVSEGAGLAAVVFPNDADGAGPENELVCFLTSSRLSPVIAKRLTEYFRMESKDDFDIIAPPRLRRCDGTRPHYWVRHPFLTPHTV